MEKYFVFGINKLSELCQNRGRGSFGQNHVSSCLYLCDGGWFSVKRGEVPENVGDAIHRIKIGYQTCPSELKCFELRSLALLLLAKNKIKVALNMMEQIPLKNQFFSKRRITVDVDCKDVEVYPGPDYSLLLIKKNDPVNSFLAIHQTTQGIVLWQLQFPPICLYEVVAELYLVIVHQREDSIKVCSLLTHQVVEREQFFNQLSKINLLVFHKNRLMCIQQRYTNEESSSLTYFELDTFEDHPMPIHPKKLKCPIDKSPVKKLDDFSMVGWSSKNEEQKLEVHIFWFRKDEKGEIRQKLTNIQVDNTEEIVGQMWLANNNITPGSLSMKEISLKVVRVIQHNQYLVRLLWRNNEKYMTLDCPEGHERAVLKQLKLKLQGKPFQLHLNSAILDNFDDVFVVRPNQLTRRSRLFFIDLKLKRVAAIANTSKQVYYYSPNIMSGRIAIEYTKQKKTREQMNLFRGCRIPQQYICSIEVFLWDYLMELKDILLCFLLHIDDDFDDDLLQDCIDLLC